MRTLKIIISTLVLIVLLDKVLYIGISVTEKKVLTGNGVGKVNHFFKVKDTTNFLVFGSSRANHHVEPLMFGKSAFNMGSGGTNIAYSNALIHTLPKNKNQTVLFQFDIDYFFEKDYEGEDVKNLGVKYHQNEVIKDKIDEIGMGNYFSSLIWCLDYNGKLLSVLKNRLSPKYNYKKYYGFDPMENTSEQKVIFKKRLQKFEKQNKIDCEKYQTGELNKKLLEDIISFCKRNNKHLIIFASPRYFDKCEEDNKIVNEVMKELNVEYYDLTNAFKNVRDLDLWKDETHLSNKGAKRLSKMLFNMINKV